MQYLDLPADDTVRCPHIAKLPWSTVCAAARSVSTKRAGATSSQRTSSWLGKGRSKLTASARCALPGLSITATLPRTSEGVAAVLVDRYAATPLNSPGGPAGDSHRMVDGARGRLLAHALLRTAHFDVIAPWRGVSRQRCQPGSATHHRHEPLNHEMRYRPDREQRMNQVIDPKSGS